MAGRRISWGWWLGIVALAGAMVIWLLPEKGGPTAAQIRDQLGCGYGTDVEDRSDLAGLRGSGVSEVEILGITCSSGEVNPYVYLYRFGSEREVNRALNRAPTRFRKQLLCVVGREAFTSDVRHFGRFCRDLGGETRCTLPCRRALGRGKFAFRFERSCRGVPLDNPGGSKRGKDKRIGRFSVQTHLDRSTVRAGGTAIFQVTNSTRKAALRFRAPLRTERQIGDANQWVLAGFPGPSVEAGRLIKAFTAGACTRFTVPDSTPAGVHRIVADLELAAGTQPPFTSTVKFTVLRKNADKS